MRRDSVGNCATSAMRIARNCTKDGGRPSGGGLQGRLPNRIKRLWSNAMVVSVEDKAHEMRQVRFKKVSASEPPLRCRNVKDGVKIGETSRFPREAQGRPAYGLGGVRHTGGTSVNQAFVWNVGTCALEEKGETQPGGPWERESTDVGERGGPPRSSEEVSVMERERRGRVIQRTLEVNQRWEEPVEDAELASFVDGTSRMSREGAPCHALSELPPEVVGVQGKDSEANN